jgi:dTDP-D-glucose 4,6-dehydratase
MKKILVTGGSGFIGSNFILSQIRDSSNFIINYDKLTYAGKNNNLIDINNNEKYKFIKGDICDKDKFINTLNEYTPDFIVNFAAESHVDRSIEYPDSFINSNIIGTFNLLTATRAYLDNSSNDQFKFIHISTDEVFGSLGNSGFFIENSPYAPTSPYSASKASSDHLARSWYHTYNFPVIISNCSNNYGPYQFP